MKVNFHPSFWLTVFTIPVFFALLSLGTWQVYRLNWKTELIMEFNRSFNDKPLTINQVDENYSNFRYRRIIVDGNFDHEKEIQLIGKTYEGTAGFHIVTPLIVDDERTILINRGWIPKKYLNKSSRKFTLLDGKVKIIGIIKLPQQKGMFVPDNEPKNGFWFTINPEEIFSYLNINGLDHFYIDQLRGDEKDILPIAIDGKIELPNNHLQYAFTWYSLALALLFIFFSWHKSKGLLKFQSNENQ